MQRSSFIDLWQDFKCASTINIWYHFVWTKITEQIISENLIIFPVNEGFSNEKLKFESNHKKTNHNQKQSPRVVLGLRPATLLKKRPWHSCFPVNFAKFLRTPFLTENLLAASAQCKSSIKLMIESCRRDH